MRKSKPENHHHRDALRQRPRSSIVTPGRPRGRLRLRETRAGTYARPAARPAQCPVCNRALGPRMLSSPDRLHGVPGTFSVARCATCGLGVTLPAARPDEIADFYPASYGAHGLPTGVQGLISAAIQRLQRRQAFRTAPLKRLADRPAGRVFDVGCGRGDLGSWLIQRGWSVTGVDPHRRLARWHAAGGWTRASARSPRWNSSPRLIRRRGLSPVPGARSDPVADLRRAVGATAQRRHGDHQRAELRLLAAPSLRRGVVSPRPATPPVPFRRRRAADHARVRPASPTSRRAPPRAPPGLPASIQYATLGRCLFPGGLAQRIAFAACALTAPVAWLTDRLTGGGDVLHAVAYKP